MKEFLKENIKHLKNFGKYIKYIIDHLFCIILIVCIVISLCFLLTKAQIVNPLEVESQQILLAGISLENWGTWITAMGLIITAFWSLYQYNKHRSKGQQERGAEIAKLFSDDLLEKCDILGNVILQSDLNKKLIHYNYFQYTKLKNFDKTELIELFGDEICLKLKMVLFSDEIQQIYLRELAKRISLFSSERTTLQSKVYTTEEANSLFIINNQKMPFRFIELFNDVLNKLEYISMYISSQSAGSNYVYQSLHQIFLKTVKLLYPIIALQNENYSDKYFTNIICVYNHWCELNEKDTEIEKTKKKKVYKILNPKIKTV